MQLRIQVCMTEMEANELCDYLESEPAHYMGVHLQKREYKRTMSEGMITYYEVSYYQLLQEIAQ